MHGDRGDIEIDPQCRGGINNGRGRDHGMNRDLWFTMRCHRMGGTAAAVLILLAVEANCAESASSEREGGRQLRRNIFAGSDALRICSMPRELSHPLAREVSHIPSQGSTQHKTSAPLVIACRRQ